MTMIIDRVAMKKLAKVTESSIKKSTANIQLFAEQAVLYSIQHGYIEYGNMLLSWFNNGMKKQAIVNMLEQEGCFKYDEKAKSFVHQRNESSNTNGEFKPWTEYVAPEVVVSTHDAWKAVISFLKKEEKKAQTIFESGGSVAHLDLIQKLYATVADYEIEQADPEEAEEPSEEV